jgi:putative tricarboxylic transport membrane protein
MSQGTTPSPTGTGFRLHTDNLIGGAIVVVLGLALLGYAFLVPNTTIPKLLAAAVALSGIVVAVGALPVQSPRDFYGGLALVMLATLALIASAELPGQRGFAFGPGTAPRLFSFLLAALGATITVGGVFTEGPPIEKYKIRGPGLVIVGILAFAATIRGVSVTLFGIHLGLPQLGLVPATFLAFMIAILGSTEMRWIESLIAAAAMTLFCVLLFVNLLGLPFQLWPNF